MFNSTSKEKDRFRDPEDKSTEIIPFEAEEENVRHTDTEHVWHITKSSNIYIYVTGVSEGKRMKADLRISRTDKKTLPSQTQKDRKTERLKKNNKKTH